MDFYLLNEALSSFFLNFFLAFYLILALQWYAYKLKRVIFYYAKAHWHIYFLILPWFFYLLFPQFFLFFSLIYAFIFYFWYKKLDKKLVFTTKIKVFFIFVLSFNLIFALLGYFLHFRANLYALIFALFALKIFDLYQNAKFINLAQNKLDKLNKLQIILITASYGKTSMKNFLAQILQDDFKLHSSARSVNTLLGIVRDINENLSEDCEIYIAEAGARTKGDILKLTQLLKPQLCIIGEIGSSHLQYFKSEENIRTTKLEALQSPRLKMAFLHSSTLLKANEKQMIYDNNINEIKASFQGLEFKLLINDKQESFKAPLLGAFNAQNLSACILCASYLGLNTHKIKEKITHIKGVKHRLEIICKEPKFIIDDGFNGNFEGMKQSYELCKNYQGRKVLVTPGIVEVNDEQNKALCELINQSFDLVIIIGNINNKLLNSHLHIDKISLKNKNELVATLAKETKNGDLILFSNDTPNFM